MASLTLIGYAPSVYSRAVRIALHDLGQSYDWVEADPFGTEGAQALREYHPFARVPVLRHGAVTIYETRAILAYLAAKFGAPEPSDALRIARGAQVQGIVDAYGYWPLVRQVYAHGVFRPATGEAHDPREVAAGLGTAPAVLDALEVIAAEGIVLDGRRAGPADWLLTPMIAAFVQHPVAAQLLAARPHLAKWFAVVAAHESMAQSTTAPEVPE